MRTPSSDDQTSHCPDDAMLVRLAEQELSPSELDALATHLDRCPTCCEVVANVARSRPPPPGGVGLVPGMVLAGRYRCTERIGGGGMGVVHAAVDEVLDRTVAVKVLRGTSRVDADRLARRLRREAAVLAKFSHPNVLAVFDVGSSDAGGFVVTELCRGKNLREWLDGLDGRSATTEGLLEVLQQAGRGLAAIHRAGVTHADVKPGNILVGEDGRVVVADLGLARLASIQSHPGTPLDGTCRDTATGSVSLPEGGTPRYMAPEQRGGQAGAAADVYSFCVVALEALLGSDPRILSRANRRALSHQRGIPRALLRGLERGLAEESARRPSMETLLRRLENPAGIRVWPWLSLMVVGSAVVGCFLLVLWWGRTPTPDTPESTERQQTAAVGEMLERVGRLEAQGKEREARELALQARKAAARGSADFARAALDYGLLLQRQGQFEEARSSLEDSVWVSLDTSENALAARAALALSVPEPGYPDARSLEWLEKAEELISRMDAGPKRTELETTALEVHAFRNINSGKFEAARLGLLEAVAARERVGGPTDDEVAYAKLHLGRVLLHEQRLEDARVVFEGALAILQGNHPDGHPRTAELLLELGGLAYWAGDFQEARNWYSMAVALGEQIDLEPSPNDIHARVGLAGALLGQGQNMEARKLLVEARKRAETLQNERLVTEVVGVLGYANDKLGDFDEALSNYQQEFIALRGSSRPDDTAQAGLTCLKIAALSCWTGNFDVAARYLEEGRVAVENHFGPGSLIETEVVLLEGRIQSARGEYADAAITLQRAEALALRGVAPDHPDIAELEVDRGFVELGQERYGPAVLRFDHALELFAKHQLESLFSARAWLGLGQSQCYLGQVTDGRAALRTASEAFGAYGTFGAAKASEIAAWRREHCN